MAVNFLDGITVAGTSTFSNQVTIADSSIDGGSLIVGRKAGQPSIKSSNAFFIIDSSTDFAAINYYVNTDVVLAYGGGNVGVGDNSPSNKLSVSGNIAATGTLTSVGATFSGTTNLNGTNFMPNYIYHTGDGDTYFGFSAANTFRVNAGGATRLTVNATNVTLNTPVSNSATGSSPLFLDGSNNINKATQTFGSNAFNSTTIPTNAVLTTTNQSIGGVKTFTNDIIARTGGVDGGMKIGGWPQSPNGYGFIGTANMTGLEYCMISDGVNTFVGAGTSGALKLRGPANDSSPSIVIDGTSVTVDNGASVGTGAIRAKYKSSDNTAGLTATFTVRNGNNSGSLTFTIKDGIVTSVSSDRRLKTNITLIGTSDSGINIYTFEYKYKFSLEGVGLFQGVMSDEVPDHAVGVDENGYDVVDYSVLDVEFKRVSL